MKPTLRKVTPHPGYSFTIRKDIADAMINNWHYHPEFELLYIKRSSGTWLVGDHVGHFESGNIILTGSNLPHCYKHDPEFLVRKKAAGESIAVIFPKNVFSEEFLNIPENDAIRTLLEKSGRGLKITGKSQETCARQIVKMLDMPPTKRLIKLLTLLDMIAEKQEYSVLSSGAFTNIVDSNQGKIKCIFDYTMNHFHEKISLEHVASLVHMTRHSFCRFFKSKTKKNYLQFLLEIRIGAACKLLIEEEKNVTEVCYQSGFNNLSHFHIHFKKITGMKPLEYRKKYRS